MKALLISNPNSTTQTPGLFRHIIPQLRSVPGIELKAQFTHHPGHAKQMCSELTRDDYDVVIVVGGDGTVHEVISGLLGSVSHPRPYSELPALAIIPTGSANVFVRALGFPPDPIQAAEVLAQTLRQDQRRTIAVGTWGDDWFAVNAGFGIDADVIAQMERARRRGFAATPLRYLRVTYRAWRRARHYPPKIDVTVTDAQGEKVTASRLPFCMVSNTNPWTFLGPMPVLTNPRSSFDKGFSLFSVAQLDGVPGALGVMHMLGANLCGLLTKWLKERIYVFDGAVEVELRCDEQVEFQVDGESAGTLDHVTLTAVADAIEVFSPEEKVPPTPMSWLRLVLSFFDVRV